MTDYVLEYMIRNGLLLSVSSYCRSNWGRDYGQLDAENQAIVDDLVEEGKLVETESEEIN